MKKVIVTGANGFIGSALCRGLSAKGIEVIAVVHNYQNDMFVSDKNIRTIWCDLSQFSKLPELINDNNIDALYHLAWAGSAGEMRGNSDIQLSNVKYTCDTIKACDTIGCKRFIFASSIMEYEVAALMETDAVPSINTLYSSAKIAADYMGRAIAGKIKIDYIRALISNIYGPGEKNQRLINTSLQKLMRGEHCSFSAGEQMYDFIYIEDATKALIAAGDLGLSNKTYYIGSLQPRPLKEFLYELRDQVDPKIEIGLGEIPYEGVSLSYKEFDINALKKDTGFIPSISFAEGIQNTILWMRGEHFA